MSSNTLEDKASPSHPKSKQERIRDNQRRSRARRQEYLTDLERRLSECQITCREADIQRAAYLELQIENTKLRELLALAGVNDQFVDQYVSQAVAQAPQFPQETNPALRQLKPKLAPVDTKRTYTTSGLTSPIGQRPALSQHPPLVVGAQSLPSNTVSPTPTPTFVASPSFSNSPILNLDTTVFDWRLPSTTAVPQASQLQLEDTLRCDAFGIVTTGIFRAADENSVSCSVAKQMIDQYPLSSQEMEDIKTKLVQGFCKPNFPDIGCSVDNQTLVQVLNELSTKFP